MAVLPSVVDAALALSRAFSIATQSPWLPGGLLLVMFVPSAGCDGLPFR
jgi:hypothetical protein